jgi:Uma2 family endonuclease
MPNIFPAGVRASVPLAARQAVRVPAGAHTLSGFRAWSLSDRFPEHGRISFIAGEIFIDLSGEEIHSHVLVKGELCRGLGNLVRAEQSGMFLPSGMQLANEAAELCHIPDSQFVSWESLENGRLRLVPRAGHPGQYVELEGAPDLVAEIVGDVSQGRDTEDLRRAYHRAGIPEYWLIDARGREIDFQILLHRRTGYASAPVRSGWRRSRVFDRSFRLERTRGRMNLWVYRLHVQPAG